ncbi:MAG TPA: prepilin-type N-terminal cleavage/methylation domain-containing protein [Candidatus Angelobacter sp.]|nr:prepilin-type N-terminal cleavage/methylation domain-containing protein [Candidatus Angelobacter sp.]
MQNSIVDFRVSARRRVSGFSLIELMVAMAVFLVIGGAAIQLVKQHVPLVSSQQNQAGLNMMMRNAIAQMQVDVVNAGTGYYPGANIPAFPIGVTIFNCGDATNGCNSMTGNADCYNASTFSYGATCFDTLNVIESNPSVPPSHPSDSGANCVSTTSSVLFANPSGSTTAAQLAAAFHNGDELLLLKSDGSQMTTTTLTKDGQVAGNKVQLQHNPTGADGSNTADPFGIANTADAGNNKLGTQFCTTDWILKIDGITYSVNASNPADPQLVRSVNGVNPVVIADQIIGFKVGAMTWNTSEDQTTYLFNAPAPTPSGGCPSNCGYNNDFSLVRSVLVSVIGRTPSNPAGGFHNTFDGGPYKVESVSVVINPRNLSMNDQ